MVVPLHAEHVAAVRPMLLLVQAGALVLLLIGGVNLDNLLLIRATARSKELAVRQAIGGSRAGSSSAGDRGDDAAALAGVGGSASASAPPASGC